MSGVTFWISTPSQPRVTRPLLSQLREQLLGEVDRDGEADADVAAAAAEDRGIDADHLAAEVEQRTAGVARIDGGVGLDEVVVGALADDAGPWR